VSLFFKQYTNKSSRIIEALYAIIVVNSSWARKFSHLEYPNELSSLLWIDENYINREGIVNREEIGWVTYAANSYFARFDSDDKSAVNLYKSEESSKVKIKIRIDSYNILPTNEKAQGKVNSFFNLNFYVKNN